MALRSSWRGHLRLSLVSVPVQAFTANESGGGEIHFNQLHAECHSRIRYKKVCPIHGEVTQQEIVSGYEYEKGQYVVVEPEELAKLRQESERAINIDTFIRPEQIDPLFFEGRSYFLVPDGKAGQKPYAVLRQGLEDRNVYGLARTVLGGREDLTLLRNLGQLLTLTMLRYDSQVRDPESFEDQIAEAKVSAEELRLAEMLIDASTVEHFDFSKYEDEYTQRLKELIEAKVEGREVVASPATEEGPQVINLMDALRKSVQQTNGPAASSQRRGKKRSASHRKLAASKGRERKRKSS